MTVRLVTGYVDIPDNPYRERYARLGPELLKAAAEVVPVSIFTPQLSECWMAKFLAGRPVTEHAEGDQPLKNTTSLHIVLHEKTAWLAQAAQQFDDDVFVWMDFGIMYIPGITADLVQDFLVGVGGEKAISLPGCWPRGPVPEWLPSWRFCGTVAVCHRDFVPAFDAMVQAEAKNYIRRTNYVSWELNTWARVEMLDRLPIRQYKADHNETLLTNYGEPPCAALSPVSADQSDTTSSHM